MCHSWGWLPKAVPQLCAITGVVGGALLTLPLLARRVEHSRESGLPRLRCADGRAALGDA